MMGSKPVRCAVSQSRAWLILWIVPAVVLPAASAFAKQQPAADPVHAPAVKAPSIVCLHTEYLPIKDSGVPNWRLLRELGRQALLIAARDELGLNTRDETLGEIFPESVKQNKQDLFVFVRCQFDGSVQFQLWLAAKPGKVLPAKKEQPHKARVILNEVEKLESRIHHELADKLRSLGFEGTAKPPNKKNLPSDSVEGQLLEMNYVSQFAAVRAAHTAIAVKGESLAWLDVLARGYAHLSLMTEHHWKSDTEVFAARALLYAQRMIMSYPNNWQAHATRAYVRAVVGLHGAALNELKKVDDLRKVHSDAPALPGWFDLIEPYCSFQRESVQALGQQRPSLRQLAQRLSFEQARAFGDERWFFESAKQTLSVCPEDYSVSAMLTVGDPSLSVGRTGAYYAPAALAHFLPPRIAALKSVPQSVRDSAGGKSANQTDETKEGDKKAKANNKKSSSASAPSAGQYAAATIPIVEALRNASRTADDNGEPSWSALGELIFEEQFVQAANYLNISLNATESSHADEVAAMLPAIKGHRYQRFIESFAVNASREPERFREIVGDMPIVDARGNMSPMLTRCWYLPTETGHNSRGCDASRDAFYDRSLTFNGMLEVTNSISGTWWNTLGPQMRKLWAADYRAISPHSPQVLRIESSLVEEPTYEQVAQWESEAGEDPTIFDRLGTMYYGLKQYDDAERCYQRSIALSPTKGAFVHLAYTYRAAGQEDMWLPTLERFFKVEPLGLEQAAVHRIIADDFIDKDNLKEAEPHALAAAETWSAWGLELASRVEEGLGHWNDSEKWIREESTNYPTG
ncbi:MAG TPA: tetratricopeptide repeat protein, partial [Lacipirellulaceae bacterium]|nr:tetratricopeptide repeat protein [Lacipirellulaceae bacterium]